jgi:pimeloyl-ACP methyl ester carboxylesterase
VLHAARPAAHRAGATFLGDVLTYLRQREADGAHGQIAALVAADLERAETARTPNDPQLLVIAHSMGGNIVYDLLSHLRTDLRCDVLVTVGSQPGLFAELGLFPAVDPPVDPTTDRVPALHNVGRWINVFDPADALAFAAEGIFDGVEDFRYRTGKGLVKAHSSYFGRPSFYVRLAARLGGTP